ncbi:hypothetical protein ACFWA9_31035 [Kitasatospora sp. NPDC059973]|uniref:FtsB family cell division protein n=1 Tax=Kitasatospora sp. NPDC059973 TaxID=3347020 RepID=UPI0036A72224
MSGTKDGLPKRGAKPGRRTNDDLNALAPDVHAFVKALRTHVLEPLKDQGINYRRLSEYLTERFGNGYSLSTVQRIGSGDKVPPRDVLDHLLDLADNHAGPLGDDDRSTVTGTYLPALRHDDPILHQYYELQDQLDRHHHDNEGLRADNEALRAENARLRAALETLRHPDRQRYLQQYYDLPTRTWKPTSTWRLAPELLDPMSAAQAGVGSITAHRAGARDQEAPNRAPAAPLHDTAGSSSPPPPTRALHDQPVAGTVLERPDEAGPGNLQDIYWSPLPPPGSPLPSHHVSWPYDNINHPTPTDNPNDPARAPEEPAGQPRTADEATPPPADAPGPPGTPTGLDHSDPADTFAEPGQELTHPSGEQPACAPAKPATPEPHDTAPPNTAPEPERQPHPEPGEHHAASTDTGPAAEDSQDTTTEKNRPAGTQTPPRPPHEPFTPGADDADTPRSADQLVALLGDLTRRGQHEDARQSVLRYADIYTPTDTGRLALQLHRAGFTDLAQLMTTSYRTRTPQEVADLVATLRNSQMERVVPPLMEAFANIRPVPDIAQLARRLHGPSSDWYADILLSDLGPRTLSEYADLVEALPPTRTLTRDRLGDRAPAIAAELLGRGNTRAADALAPPPAHETQRTGIPAD